LARVIRDYTVTVDRGESFATDAWTSTGVFVSEELSTGARTDSERRGITIGILVVALLCLSLFFFWHHYGVPGSGARPAAESAR
jgi:hypothetical protein